MLTVYSWIILTFLLHIKESVVLRCYALWGLSCWIVPYLNCCKYQLYSLWGGTVIRSWQTNFLPWMSCKHGSWSVLLHDRLCLICDRKKEKQVAMFSLNISTYTTPACNGCMQCSVSITVFTVPFILTASCYQHSNCKHACIIISWIGFCQKRKHFKGIYVGLHAWHASLWNT